MSNNSRGFSSNQAGATYPNQNRQIVDNKSVFFSQTNYGRLLQPLRANFERKLNQPELPERMDKRLQDVLSHYMNEIYEITTL